MTKKTKNKVGFKNGRQLCYEPSVLKLPTQTDLKRARAALTELRRAMRPVLREWSRLSDLLGEFDIDDHGYAVTMRRIGRIEAVMNEIEEHGASMPGENGSYI
jgi:hypothetical protein